MSKCQNVKNVKKRQNVINVINVIHVKMSKNFKNFKIVITSNKYKLPQKSKTNTKKNSKIAKKGKNFNNMNAISSNLI